MQIKGLKSVIATVVGTVSLLAVFACAHPVDQDSDQKPGPAASPTPRLTNGAPVGKLNFPTFSKEQQTAAKALKAGDALPFRTERDYLILRYGGIRVPRGDYFARPLTESNGACNHFLFCKKATTNPGDVDMEKAIAKDGSFAAILDIVSPIQFADPFSDTRAYTSSSGESGAVWFHFKGQKIEYRGELMGYAGPSSGLIKTQ